MEKLIIHTGLFNRITNTVEILGDLTFTNKQMFELGKNLLLPEKDKREVFTNNAQIIEGLKYNILNKKIDPSKIIIIFYQNEIYTHKLWLKSDGKFNYYPQGLLE